MSAKELKRKEWRDGIEGQACAACGSHVNVQAHHIIARAELRDRGLLHLVWDTRNRLPLCAEPAPNRCHDRHTCAFKRVPLAILPEAAWEFAREIGLEWYLERFYDEQAVA